MLIKDVQACSFFTAGDSCQLCELLHPTRDTQATGLGYSIAYGFVPVRGATRPHRLKANSEVYYILEGVGIIQIEVESAPIHAHQAVYVPPGSIQHLENTGRIQLTFLCIVEPRWQAGDEEIDPPGL